MNIGVVGFILSVICDGYKILFIVFLFFKISFNNGLVLKEKKFVFEVIFNFIRNKCLEVLDYLFVIVNFFLVFI